MKFKKLITLSSVLTPVAFFAFSCASAGTKDSQSSLISKATQSKNEVIFTTSQGKFWPLISALNEYGSDQNGLIPYYNKTFKNDKDFVEVKLLLNDKSKAITQADTANNINSILATDGDNLPSIALADSSTAFVANRYNRLLDLSSSKIKSDLFNENIFSYYNSLTLNNNNNFYNIPFNVSDVDATSFNLDNLRTVFDLIKKGGGQIDEEMELYKNAQKSKDEGNSIKETNLFSAIDVKSNDVFKDLKVNLSTFTNIEDAIDFANTFTNGIKVDSSKTSKLNEKTENVSLFVIDYSDNIFLKNILSKSGKYLWEANKNGTGFDYSIANDSSLQNIFEQTYKKFTDKINKVEFNVSGSKKYFQAFQFKNFKNGYKGFGEWGSHDILRYKTAFGFVPSVGIKQSIDSQTSRVLGFEDPQNFATFKDVYTIGQPLKSTNNSPFSSYWPGGSSIIALKTNNEKVDKGTIKFLNWLFTGKNTISGKEVSNIDYLIEKSAYFVPTKDVVTNSKLEEIKKLYEQTLNEIEKKAKEAGVEKNKTFEVQKSPEVKKPEATSTTNTTTNASSTSNTTSTTTSSSNQNNDEKLKKLDLGLYDKLSNLRSVIVSLESMLNSSNDAKSKIILDIGDAKTNKVKLLILDSLINSTQYENSSIKTYDDLIRNLKNTILS